MVSAGLLPTQIDVAAWVTLALLVFGPGLAAATITAPFLAADRLRSLFRTLPPTDSVVVSYLLVTVGGSLPYVVGTGAILTAFAGSSPASGATVAERLLGLATVVSLVVVVGWPTVCGLVLPEVGYDWDPTGYGWDTWLLLIGGAVWYVAGFTVVLGFAAFFLALPT